MTSLPIASMKLPNFSVLIKTLKKKVTEILGWQNLDKVNPLIEQCIAAAKS